MKILVVDDDLVTLSLLEKYMMKLGHEPLFANDGIMAWDLFINSQVGMVITDWMMPNMNGLDLCTKIRSSGKRGYTYIIVLTANDQKNDLIKMFEAGADDYIIKPLDLEELRVRIKTGERILRLENEHKELESILIESRNKLRIVLDSLQEEIVAVDSGFRIVSINNAFIQHVGISFADLHNRPCFKEDDGTLFPFNKDKIEKIVSTVFETGKSEFFLDTLNNVYGDMTYREISCLPVKDEDGKVFQAVIVSKDVTDERKKSEEITSLNQRLQDAVHQVKAKNQKLQQTLQRLKETQVQMLHSEKMSSIGQLAAGVAHEINNPTGFVSSNLETLSDYQEDMRDLILKYRSLVTCVADKWNNEGTCVDFFKQASAIREKESQIDIDFILQDATDLIKESREGVERIKKIVLNLKDFAHPGVNEAQLADINRSIESTLNIVWNELKYKATVKKNFSDLPQVNCYPQQLNQVFMNLLVNAAQAIDKEGEINITTRNMDGKVEITISDTGCGIPRENLSKIFDPFFTTKEVGKGTGLGLNVAYNIIKKHKGTINVESEVGKGTRFIIQLPLDPPMNEAH